MYHRMDEGKSDGKNRETQKRHTRNSARRPCVPQQSSMASDVAAPVPGPVRTCPLLRQAHPVRAGEEEVGEEEEEEEEGELGGGVVGEVLLCPLGLDDDEAGLI